MNILSKSIKQIDNEYVKEAIHPFSGSTENYKYNFFHDNVDNYFDRESECSERKKVFYPLQNNKKKEKK